MAKDPEEYVDLTLICSFSRMREVLKVRYNPHYRWDIADILTFL
jgi:hypothetical protein